MLLNENLISIIMPAYNSERYISDSIKSVINQTYEKWELLVIDDCSTDGTKGIVEAYADKDNRIRLYTQSENRGVVNARNKAIRYAKGRFIAFLDSDDLWKENKLEIQVNFMVQNNIAFSYTDYSYIDSNNNIIKCINCPHTIDYAEALRGNQIGCLTVMLDRKYIVDFSMVNMPHEDYASWLRIFKSGTVAVAIKENLAMYRKTNYSLSSNKIKMIKWTWNIYRKSEKLSIIKSLIYLCYHLFRGVKKHFLRY